MQELVTATTKELKVPNAEEQTQPTKVVIITKSPDGKVLSKEEENTAEIPEPKEPQVEVMEKSTAEKAAEAAEKPLAGLSRQDMKEQLHTELKDKIAEVMKDNKDASPEKIREILKTKLKGLLEDKIAAMKANEEETATTQPPVRNQAATPPSTPNTKQPPVRSAQEPAVAAPAAGASPMPSTEGQAAEAEGVEGLDSPFEDVREAAKELWALKTKHQKLVATKSQQQAQLEHMKAEYAAQQAKKMASKAAAKAAIVAHAKAVVAENIDKKEGISSPNIIKMADSAKAAAAGSVADARAAKKQEAEDKASMDHLEDELKYTTQQVDTTKEQAVKAQTSVERRQLRNAKTSLEKSMKKMSEANQARVSADGAMSRANEALATARKVGNPEAVQTATALRAAALAAKVAADKDAEEASRAKSSAQRIVRRDADKNKEAEKVEEESEADDTASDDKVAEAKGKEKIAEEKKTEAAKEESRSQGEVAKEKIAHQKAEQELQKAMSSGNDAEVAAAQSKADTTKKSVQEGIKAETKAQETKDADKRAVEREQAEAQKVEADKYENKVATLERQLTAHKMKKMELEAESTRSHAIIVRRKHALQQARKAMDQAKHALELAHKADLVSAADAAKHMMQVTKLVVDKANAKVAEEQAKKDEADKAAKEEGDNIVKKTAALDAERKIQETNTPGGEAVIAAFGTDAATPAGGVTPAAAQEQGKIEGALLRREDEAVQAEKKVEEVKRASEKKITEAKEEETKETAKADEAAEEKKDEARKEEEKKDKAAEGEAEEAKVEAEKKTEEVKEQKSAGAAQVAAEQADVAQKDAEEKEEKEKETIEEDKQAEKKDEQVADVEDQKKVEEAKDDAAETVKEEQKKIDDAAEVAKEAQENADKAQKAEENEASAMEKATSNAGAEDKQAQLDALKEKLKTTTNVGEMTSILGQIKKLKDGENAAPVQETQEKTEKLRINSANDRARSMVMNTKEDAEKKLEQDKMAAEAKAQKEVAAQQALKEKTDELTRKEVDKVKAEAGVKTARAEKEADSLKSTLMQFMKHAHDRLFSQEAQDKFSADDKATAAKAEREKAQDELHAATLAQAVADTQADAAAEKLKGIMAQISEDSSDHELLQTLSEKAQSIKGEVMASRAKATAAAQTVAEKKQIMSKYTVAENQQEKEAEAEDKKVADEQEAQKKEEEQMPEPEDPTRR